MSFKIEFPSNENEDSSLTKDEAREKKLDKQILKSGQTGEFVELAEDLQASSDLTDALDLDSLEGDTLAASNIAKNELQSQIDRAFASIGDIKQQFSTKVTEKTLHDLFPANEDKKVEYLKLCANKLYRETYRAARLFLRDYCVVNSMRQKWTNPFGNTRYSQRKGNENTPFIPKVYNISLVDRNTNKSTMLIDMELTAQDATIQGAKKLGFDTSMHRNVVLAHFSKETLDILMNDLKYMREQIAFNTYQEHVEQVNNNRFITPTLRDKWLKELEEKYRKSSLNTMI